MLTGYGYFFNDLIEFLGIQKRIPEVVLNGDPEHRLPGMAILQKKKKLWSSLCYSLIMLSNIA